MVLNKVSESFKKSDTISREIVWQDW